jgi:hypothetical protein
MIFTAFDVSPLSQSLHCWEMAEYISEAFVIFACAGEMIADLGETWLGEGRKRRVERHSTMLLVTALSVSLICLVRTNELSGSVIGSLGEKADEADRKAKVALSDSATAASQAKDALDKAGKAKQEAENSKIESGEAFLVAKQTEEYAAWRTIPDKECKAMRKVTSVLHSRTLVVEANPSDDETWGFANRINNCLGTIGTATVWQPGMTVPPGLSFSIGKDRHADFETVISALEVGGLGKADELRKRADDRAQHDFLLLVVGPRH